MSTNGETVLWSGSYSSRAMAGFWALSVLAFVGCTVLAFLVFDGWVNRLTLIGLSTLPGLWCVILAAYRHLTLWYSVSSRRIVSGSGLLAFRVEQVEMMRVEDVSCGQSGLDRLFGIGTIIVQSSDKTDPTLLMLGIENVRQVAELIGSTAAEQRSKHGMVMGAGA